MFGFFTEPDKLTRWLCTEATVDPRPGGAIHQTFRSEEARPDPLEMLARLAIAATGGDPDAEGR